MKISIANLINKKKWNISNFNRTTNNSSTYKCENSLIDANPTQNSNVFNTFVDAPHYATRFNTAKSDDGFLNPSKSTDGCDNDFSFENFENYSTYCSNMDNSPPTSDLFFNRNSLISEFELIRDSANIASFESSSSIAEYIANSDSNEYGFCKINDAIFGKISNLGENIGLDYHNQSNNPTSFIFDQSCDNSVFSSYSHRRQTSCKPATNCIRRPRTYAKNGREFTVY